MFDKPWFSRKQLNIIIVVTTLAIALLSMTGKDRPLPKIQRDTLDQVAIYHFDDSKAEAYRLAFSFALPPTETASDLRPQLLHQLLSQRLQALSQQAEMSVILFGLALHRDRLVLSVTTPQQPQPSQLNALLKACTDTFAVDKWQQQRDQLQAQRYLNQQNQPAPLTLISPLLGRPVSDDAGSFTQWRQYQQQLFSTQQLSISLIGEETGALLPKLQQSLAELPHLGSWTPIASSWPAPQRNNNIAAPNLTLLARQTQGKNQPGYATELISMHWLRSQLAAEQAQSDWFSAADSGLWLVISHQLTADQLLSQLQQQVTQLTDKQIDAQREQLLQQLNNQSEHPQQQFQQLQSIAFYQLPVDYLQQLQQQLQQTTAKQIRQRLAELLQPQQFYWLSRTAK